MRKLASIKTISNLEPIQGADMIELATVGGWKVVVAKNVQHQIGNKVVYCEIDSFLPIEPEFEFLRKSSYKKLIDGTEGFRLRTVKLRGQISQGLILPLQDAIDVMKRRNGEVYFEMLEEGTDVSELLGITKYEPPVPANLGGTVKGQIPGFIEKTDEERIQNLTNEYEQWRIQSKHQFYITEKLDGSSATFYIKDGEFGVCSRNLELAENADNSFWKVARELDFETKMKSLRINVSFQGELIGEGIQGNPYKIKGQTVRFFNIFDIDNYCKVPRSNFLSTLNDLGLESVPYLEEEFQLPDTVEELLKLAEGKSQLNSNTEREGLVIRSMDNTISFKVISNKFLLKNE